MWAREKFLLIHSRRQLRYTQVTVAGELLFMGAVSARWCDGRVGTSERTDFNVKTFCF